MIDVGAKKVSARTATAEASLHVPPCVTAALFRQLPRQLFLQRNKLGTVAKGVPRNLKKESTGAAAAGASREFQLQALVSSKKGPILHTAVIAGTNAVKQTSSLIPFCHPLPVERVQFEFAARLLRKCPFPRRRRRSLQPPVKPAGRRGGAVPRNVLVSIELISRCTVGVSGKTGVEMEALTGSTVAALALYDMLKGIPGAQEAGLGLVYARVLAKRGGKADFGGHPPPLSSSSSSSDSDRTEGKEGLSSKKIKKLRKKRQQRKGQSL
jgi:molybdenum cofactor biosynthesis enzyme